MPIKSGHINLHNSRKMKCEERNVFDINNVLMDFLLGLDAFEIIEK